MRSALANIWEVLTIVGACIGIAIGAVISFAFLFLFAALFALVAVVLGVAFSPAAVVLAAFHKGPLLAINYKPAAKAEDPVPNP